MSNNNIIAEFQAVLEKYELSEHMVMFSIRSNGESLVHGEQSIASVGYEGESIYIEFDDISFSVPNVNELIKNEVENVVEFSYFVGEVEFMLAFFV